MHGIVFVPGISGSELIYKDQSPPIWPPNWWDIPVGYLELSELLDPTNITVGKVIDSVLGIPIYQVTENDLESISSKINGVPNGPYLAVPYDWRISLTTAVDTLATAIATFANSPGMTEITIVAHSMGGLLTRLLLEWKYADSASPAWFSKISQALFLCTPHLGAPTALPRLLGLELTEYVIQPWQMQQIANDSNFPAVYQLLPSPSSNILFDTNANKYIPYNDPQVIKAFGLSTQNLNAESSYSQALKPANKPPNVSYFFVYGTGQWTDEYLEVAGLSLYGASARQDEQGDGTVPSWSVVRAAAQFSPHIPLAPFLGSHVDVLQSDAFRQFLYSYFGVNRPAPLVTDAAGVLVSLNKRAYAPGETIHVLIIPDEEASVISGSLILHRISADTREANILGSRQEVTFRGGSVRSLTSKITAPRTPGVYRLDFGGRDSSHKTSSEVAGWFVVPGAKRSDR
jgi:phospholipase A1